jgi:hypothetical protein
MIAVAIGYVASVFLAVSLMMTNDLKFRWLNLCGCSSFITYALLINATPVLVTNSMLFLINLFYLIRTYNRKEDFDLMEFQPGEKIINKFLQFHQKDIQAYFPNFKLAGGDNDLRFIVLRDMVIANIFVAELTADGTAYVKINYTVPKYRDYKIGTFIFDKEKKFLVSKGVKQIAYNISINKNHTDFLRKMGFVTSEGMLKKAL